jgi:hypothetical protein
LIKAPLPLSFVGSDLVSASRRRGWARNWAISDKISANIRRDTATSAI